MARRVQAIHSRPDAVKSKLEWPIKDLSYHQILNYNFNDLEFICKHLRTKVGAIPVLYSSYEYPLELEVYQHNVIWLLFNMRSLPDVEMQEIHSKLSTSLEQLQIEKLVYWSHLMLSLSLALRTSFQYHYVRNIGMLLNLHIQMMGGKPRWQQFFQQMPASIFSRIMSQDYQYLVSATQTNLIKHDPGKLDGTQIGRSQYYLVQVWISHIATNHAYILDSQLNRHLATKLVDFLLQIDPDKQHKVECQIRRVLTGNKENDPYKEIYNQPTILDLIWYFRKEHKISIEMMNRLWQERCTDPIQCYQCLAISSEVNNRL